jgi:hypothetical protein
VNRTRNRHDSHASGRRRFLWTGGGMVGLGELARGQFLLGSLCTHRVGSAVTATNGLVTGQKREVQRLAVRSTAAVHPD